MTKLKFYKTHPDIELPKFQTEQSACFDICFRQDGKTHYEGFNSFNSPIKRNFSTASIHIASGERVMVPTGLIMDIPEGYSVRVHPRSGLSFKKGIILANLEGIVDSYYVEELFLLIHNTSLLGITFQNGDRLAQGELIKLETYTMEETTERPAKKTSRDGGMGSTGVSKEKKVKTEKKLDKEEAV